MGYFQSRNDVKFIQEFRGNVLKLWEIEARASKKVRNNFFLPEEYNTAVREAASSLEGYQEVRENVSKGVLRATRLAKKYGVPIMMSSYPPPAVGGPIIPINLFNAVLVDNSYSGIERQLIYDALIQTISVCEEAVDKELIRLINPLYWLREILIFLIRIPFMLIEASGFNVSKFEDHFLAKFFKLIEIMLIIYILISFGFKMDQIKDIIAKVFLK